MKSYTDIEQSRKLKKILPLESADMHYIIMGDDEEPQTIVGLGEYIGILPTIPAWSLSALIQVLPITIVDTWTDYCLMLDIKAKMPRYVKYGDVYHPEFPWDFKKQSLLDSVVESIFWLHNNSFSNGSNRSNLFNL